MIVRTCLKLIQSQEVITNIDDIFIFYFLIIIIIFILFTLFGGMLVFFFHFYFVYIYSYYRYYFYLPGDVPGISFIFSELRLEETLPTKFFHHDVHYPELSTCFYNRTIQWTGTLIDPQRSVREPLCR